MSRTPFSQRFEDVFIGWCIGALMGCLMLVGHTLEEPKAQVEPRCGSTLTRVKIEGEYWCVHRNLWKEIDDEASKPPYTNR